MKVVNTRSPIGVFDSGVGGLSLVAELRKIMPSEDIVYLADTKNSPYGTKSKEEIEQCSLRCAGWLRNQGAKAILVACNTASAYSMRSLNSWSGYVFPTMGLIPDIAAAVQLSQTKHIATLSSARTAKSEMLDELIATYAQPLQVEVDRISNPSLTAIVEAGGADSAKALTLLAETLDPTVRRGADVLVIACTHYPFLIPQIRNLYGRDLVIIDTGSQAAEKFEEILDQSSLKTSNQRLGTLSLFTTGNLLAMKEVSSVLLGEDHLVGAANL